MNRGTAGAEYTSRTLRLNRPVSDLFCMDASAVVWETGAGYRASVNFYLALSEPQPSCPP